MQCDMWGELVAEILGGRVEAGECAAEGGCCCEFHERAEVVVPAEAGLAPPAGCAGFEGDAVTYCEGCDGGADGGYGACGFVAETVWGGEVSIREL